MNLTNNSSILNGAIVKSITTNCWWWIKSKKVWAFKYNQKALEASTMKNVKANINYEYDITNEF